MGNLNCNISTTPLKVISIKNGDVLHALKKTEMVDDEFGEAYFSWINPGVIKGWKRHSKMTMRLVVPVGLVKFVFTDNGINYDEICIGENKNYKRLNVGPGVWFAFCSLMDKPSLILNIANIIHEEDEVQREELSHFNYKWT
jgi:dTDP-4-dehydrorhamnose 3,5-epimerase